MKKKFWFCRILCIGIVVPAIADIPTVQSIVNGVSQYNASSVVDSYQEFLIGNASTPNPLYVRAGDDRRTGCQDLVAAQSFVVSTMNSYLGAAHVQSQTFSGGVNYVGDLVGSNPSSGVVLIGAHIDATQSRSGGSAAPGGDDNGTGVAGMLEAMRVLSHYEFEKTIRFVLFDAEESGMDGSQAYMNSLSLSGKGEIVSVTSFDMVGYNHNGNNIATLCIKDTEQGREWQGQFADAVNTYSTLTPDLTKVSKWSDHDAFDAEGIAAGLLVEELSDASWPVNPYYHTTSDYVLDEDGNFQTLKDGTTQYVDLAYATEMTKATVGWAATLASPIPEPATIMLFGGFAGGLFAVRRIFKI